MAGSFISMKVDASRAIAGLNAAAKSANQDAVKGIRKAAKDVALPIARNAVNGELPGTTTAGATSRGAYVGQRHPGAGVNEFGGTVSARIVPRNGRAVLTPYGPKAYVDGPRTYHAKHVLFRGVEQARPAMAKPIRDAILDAYRPYFDIV